MGIITDNIHTIPLKISEGLFALKTLNLRLVLCCSTLVLLLSGCVTGNAEAAYSKYSAEFFDTFDTIVIVVAYAKTEEEFDGVLEKVHTRFVEMHKMFDIYHDYEGMNNLKTINDSAGIRAVEADRCIIDIIKIAKRWHEATGGIVNIAMGPVLKIWHEYREAGISDPAEAKLPPMEVLRQAAHRTDIDNVLIDEDNSTVYLKERGMSLDVGAIAKGYAAEVVARELMSLGYDSVLISAGGNIRAIGAPKDGVRNKWGVGIKDPESPLELSTSEDNLLDVAFVSNASVVSSGTYERYYTVEGADYHHIIDPETLMPADHYKAVTVITGDSASADALSTALFIMQPEDSLEFAESIDAEALWVMPGGELMMTSGMNRLLRDMGGASSK